MIRGATVLPVDAAFSQTEAIAVRAGRIVAVGTEAGPAELTTDLLDRVSSEVPVALATRRCTWPM
ncbi:MAG: hypothetical protein ACR2LA_08295 [Acidimicrobiales bacterium]